MRRCDSAPAANLQVIHLPPAEVWAVHFPVLAFPNRAEDKRSLACAYQDSDCAHAGSSTSAKRLASMRLRIPLSTGRRGRVGQVEGRVAVTFGFCFGSAPVNAARSIQRTRRLRSDTPAGGCDAGRSSVYGIRNRQHPRTANRRSILWDRCASPRGRTDMPTRGERTITRNRPPPEASERSRFACSSDLRRRGRRAVTARFAERAASVSRRRGRPAASPTLRRLAKSALLFRSTPAPSSNSVDRKCRAPLSEQPGRAG